MIYDPSDDASRERMDEKYAKPLAVVKHSPGPWKRISTTMIHSENGDYVVIRRIAVYILVIGGVTLVKGSSPNGSNPIFISGAWAWATIALGWIAIWTGAMLDKRVGE